MESTTYTLGRTAPEDMRPYPQASIELVPAEQELLIVLSKGIDPLAEMEKGRNPFANRPSKRMIGRAYAALERIGAIDAKHAVTPMGTKLLDFPLHPVTGRILVEAYETEKPLRSSTLECVSIFGQRGFLSGDKEKKWRMLAGTAEKSPATDFGEIHTLFRLMMSTDPTDVDLERIRKAFVAAYGQTESDRTALRYRLNELERIKRERVPTDNEPTPPARLYERVDFSVFGIRNIDLKRIERNLARLRTALSEKGVEISDTPLLDERTLVKASLVSMSEHVFTGTKDEQGRPALRHARTGEIYSPGYSSVTAITDGQRYVATPFVAEDDEERIRIATFVSAVRPEWILEAEASNRSGSATNGETGKTAKTAKKNVDRTLLESPAAIREKYASVYGDRGNIWGNLKQTDFSKCRKQATLAAVWLADFVLAQNHGLRNYFAQRDVFLDSKTWRKKLSEMLDEVVMAHARYIDPTDRGRTERRFRSIGAEEFLHADPA